MRAKIPNLYLGRTCSKVAVELKHFYMRLNPADALRRLRTRGYTGKHHPQNAIFFTSALGLCAGKGTKFAGAPMVMECVLRETCVDVFSPSARDGKKKVVTYPVFWSLLEVWEGDSSFGKQRACSSREYPSVNSRYVITKMIEIVHASEPDKPLVNYLKKFIFNEPWNLEVKVNLLNQHPEYTMLPSSTVRPKPRVVWGNCGSRGVFMVLGATPSALRALGSLSVEAPEPGVHIAEFGAAPVDVHGGPFQGMLFFGWCGAVKDVLEHCPASVNMAHVCVVANIAYVCSYRVMTARLIRNAISLLKARFTIEHLRAVATASELQCIWAIVGRSQARKRKRALEVGSAPPCMEAVAYLRGNLHAKHTLRWYAAAVAQKVARDNGITVNDILDVVAMKLAWARMPLDSQREFFHNMGIEGDSPSKPYTVTCRMMNSAHRCPFDGNSDACAKHRGHAASVTVAAMWQSA